MAILQDNMQPQAAPAAQPAPAPGPAAEGAPLPKPNPSIMSPVVQGHVPELDKMSKMLDGKLGEAYDRVLTAGMKMLYSPQNAETVQKLIFDDEIPMANKLGEGTANLIVMMDNQGNGTIPKEVLIPVGVALMFEAADYLFEVGLDVTDEDLGNALELMINGVFVGYGIDPAKMDQIVDDMGQKLGFADTEQGKAVAGMKGAEPTEVEDEDAAFNKGFADEQTARAQV